MTMPLTDTHPVPAPVQTTVLRNLPAFRSISIPYYSGSQEPVSSSVNLAVSSLRTQVDSPPHTFQQLPGLSMDAHASLRTPV